MAVGKPRFLFCPVRSCYMTDMHEVDKCCPHKVIQNSSTSALQVRLHIQEPHHINSLCSPFEQLKKSLEGRLFSLDYNQLEHNALLKVPSSSQWKLRLLNF
uniref:Uncharacterized protein n=1 Tax=Opuntia streptacantha TaxID=393608 RepID=A0A7C9D261_OPUST